MKILITAGNTQAAIDKVRCITNIFTGRTGAQIALYCQAQGHAVTLLTSHPDAVDRLAGSEENLRVLPYRTFDDLAGLLRRQLQEQRPDAVVHSAAVSDFTSGGIYAPSPATGFCAESGQWESADGAAPALVDVAAGKVKSDSPELWLRLVRTPKLIDLMRPEWGFAGVLVKFKLEVGVADDDLLAIAEKSRRHSAADLMVANTLEGASAWAFVGPMDGGYQRIERKDLPAVLLGEIEKLYAEKNR